MMFFWDVRSMVTSARDHCFPAWIPIQELAAMVIHTFKTELMPEVPPVGYKLDYLDMHLSIWIVVDLYEILSTTMNINH